MGNCHARVLFILKYREGLDKQTGEVVSQRGLSSGLANSARFVRDMLAGERVEVSLIHVVDNNDIDREVTRFKPTHVIIEAFWVVPEKFDVLNRLHPSVKWIIRSHSEVPFLAQEGVAMDWILKYVQHDSVMVANNSEKGVNDCRTIIAAAYPDWSTKKVSEKLIYLPNYYPYRNRRKHVKVEDEYLDVACFGAIRPLKNQLIQAVASIQYAEMIGKKLRFHINGSRDEQGGAMALRNLRAIFEKTPNCQLLEEPWMNHTDFLNLLTKMDIGMQVTFTETFNIVSADMVVAELPIVVSGEVSWTHRWCQAECTSTDDIVDKMVKVHDWRFRNIVKYLNLKNLTDYCEKSRRIWMEYFTS